MQSKALIIVILGITVCSSAFGASNSDRRTVPLAAAVAERPQGAGYAEPDAFEDYKWGQAYANQQQYEKAIEVSTKLNLRA